MNNNLSLTFKVIKVNLKAHHKNEYNKHHFKESSHNKEQDKKIYNLQDKILVEEFKIYKIKVIISKEICLYCIRKTNKKLLRIILINNLLIIIIILFNRRNFVNFRA